MDIKDFIDVLGVDFFTGVPDSQLKALCNYLMDTYGIDEKHHIIAANEGNSVAIAAGYHLATGNIPVIYLQNSGEGNIINPVASLLNSDVYAIPCIFIIGWRGQPGVHDEPQHIYQGKITTELLDLMDIKNYNITKETTLDELETKMREYNDVLSEGKNVAFVISKNALSYDNKVEYSNENDMVREEIIEHIVDISNEDPIISTTGKASRELFEIRTKRGQSHKYDFLTVGSMGHSSSIALGVAINKPDSKVWCIDGDGATLMHMGSLPVISHFKPSNLVHIVINNGAHETVGGMPTVASDINLSDIAKHCGYQYCVRITNFEDLDKELKTVKSKDMLCFIEVLCSIGAREDLGRPTTTTIENKNNFMDYIK